MKKLLIILLVFLCCTYTKQHKPTLWHYNVFCVNYDTIKVYSVVGTSYDKTAADEIYIIKPFWLERAFWKEFSIVNIDSALFIRKKGA